MMASQEVITTWEVFIKVQYNQARQNHGKAMAIRKIGFWEELLRGTSNYFNFKDTLETQRRGRQFVNKRSLLCYSLSTTEQMVVCSLPLVMRNMRKTAGIQNAQSFDLMSEWSLMSDVSTLEEPLLLLVFFFACFSQLG